jgi:threonine dehydrogenase-like Zn-dependent dehydrogenase
MHALLANLAAPGTLTFVTDQPEPTPAPGEVRIRVRLAGICATDLEIVRGYMNFAGVPGHEFVGVVDDVAQVSNLWTNLLGKRVVAEINCVRPDAPARDEDARKHAWPRTVLGILGRDGAFAEFVTVPRSIAEGLQDLAGQRLALSAQYERDIRNRSRHIFVDR